MLTFTFMAVNPIKISCRWKARSEGGFVFALTKGKISIKVNTGEEPICSLKLKLSAFVRGEWVRVDLLKIEERKKV